MNYYRFEIVIEKEPEDEGYYAYSPTLPGCFGIGKTFEDAKHSIKMAIFQHIETLLAKGQPLVTWPTTPPLKKGGARSAGGISRRDAK